MKLPQKHSAHAWKRIDVLIIITTVMAYLFYSWALSTKSANWRPHRSYCVDNLKEINLSFQVWANDHDDRYPMQVPASNGGAMEAVAEGKHFAVFLVMSNYARRPKLLICLADSRAEADWSDRNWRDFNRTNSSYFLGLNASTSSPAMFLCGDRNLTNGLPLRDNVLELTTSPNAGWTEEMHVRPKNDSILSQFSKVPFGNIALVDGSAHSFTIPELRSALENSGAATNRLAMP